MTTYFVRGSNCLIQILVSELAPDFFGGIGLPVYLDIRINKKVQRLPVLLGNQIDIPPQTEGDTVFGEIAEVVIAHFRVLVGFGDIDGNPILAFGLELGPAMIAGHFAAAALFGQRETDLEFGWNLLSASKRNEHAVKIGAVSVAGITGPVRIAPTPAGPFLAITHVPIHHVVQDTSRFQLILGKFLVSNQLHRFAAHGDTGIRLQETLRHVRNSDLPLEIAANFPPLDTVSDSQGYHTLIVRFPFHIKHLIAVLWFGGDLFRPGKILRLNFDFLIFVARRNRNPDASSLSRLK